MSESIKKLYRSRTDRVIWGVCGGLGEYFGVDSILFRIFFLILALGNGFGILLYLILALLIPSAPKSQAAGSERVKSLAQELSVSVKKISGEMKIESGYRVRNILGLIVLIIGILLLLQRFFHLYLDWSLIYPLLVIFLGLYFMNSYSKNNKPK
ncbi:hypothetical protein COT98_03430 [Candidatus Falkowbacteria bacterium CG10_big_fil_rev_8_21_14_0_10_39_9]|uniref:Uncharacterized protein n=1 Tax=Candidatus Falkowbacteria bacterium CG10_big_fil_rev_8_21_14_0_10_39_9 TaxID=1974566 RepID=A0A2M6WNT6_9BACT|nr:MAG: hypothetical protein COT98_03430 [Candidatus Falkowbacteria bacterium CG10_big_fil_rev_8_21_14_0_10_39_9]